MSMAKINNKQLNSVAVTAAIFSATFLLSMASGSFFFILSNSSAESSTIDVTVNPSISIATDAIGSTINIPILPTFSGIQNTKDLAVNVSTNNPTGYTLTMSSATDDTNLVNTDNSSLTIPSTTNTYAAPDVLDNNTWGASVWTTGQDTSSTTFSMIPPLSVPLTINATAEPANTSMTTLTFGAKVDTSLAAGTYTNTVVFTATTNYVPPLPIISSVSPTTNWSSGDIYITGSDFIDVTNITVGGTDCSSFRIISIDSAICVLPSKATGSDYPIALISGSLGMSNTNITVTYDGANKGNMQDFSSATCSSMPLGLTQNWTDARNGAVYRVKKMLDNKCWMIDNLAYAGGGTATYGDAHTLSFQNATSSSLWDTNLNTVNRYITTNNYTGGDLTDRQGNTIQNTTATLSSGTRCQSTATGSGVMSSQCLSYLYSWCSAVGLDGSTTPTCAAVSNSTTGTNMTSAGVVGKVGGIGGESKGNSSATNQAGVNSTTSGSVCPAGWRLPVGRIGSGDNTKNEFAMLNASMNSATLNLIPDVSGGTGYYQNWQPAGSFSGIGSGYFRPGTGLYFQSAYGYYWSSSLYSSVTALGTSLNATNVSPGTVYNFSRDYGLTVRCVLN